MGMMRFGYRSDYLQSTDVTICFPSGKLTTREPDASQAEVAIKAVEAVFDWRKYLADNF